jgi:hypothetical protein
MTATATRTFPAYSDVVRELVEEHLEIEGQPLLLALYYAPEHDLNDIFLFEVVDKFGGNRVSEDNEFMEVTFGADSGLRIRRTQRLHLVITNPNEVNTAIRNKWPDVVEIGKAIAQDRYQQLYIAPGYGEILLRDLRYESAIG